jgi:hypothetical protein
VRTVSGLTRSRRDTYDRVPLGALQHDS